MCMNDDFFNKELLRNSRFFYSDEIKIFAELAEKMVNEGKVIDRHSCLTFVAKLLELGLIKRKDDAENSNCYGHSGTGR